MQKKTGRPPSPKPLKERNKEAAKRYRERLKAEKEKKKSDKK